MAQRKSVCTLCGYLCGLIANVDSGDKLVSVEPDSSRYPYDERVIKRCRRFASNVEFLDHPARLNYPLKRRGRRGSGQWERVTWDEALDEIALRLNNLKSEHGAETLATSIAAPHNLYWPLHRFLNLFGSPNNMGIGQICWNPAIWVNAMTYGWPIEPEVVPGRTRCVILWGYNPAASDNSLFWRTVHDYSRAGGYVAVIDPRRTRTVSAASKWLAVRPGSDGALALAMIHVILEEDLYDHHFVGRWCSGLEELRERAKDYAPQMASAVTGVPAEAIAEVARAYATLKPGALISGLGIDQSGVNCTQTLRSLAILRAITGNVDIEGACHLGEMPDFVPECRLELSEMLPAEQAAKRLGQQRFRLPTNDGFERLAKLTRMHGKTLPSRYLTSVHPNLVWKAMIHHDPYPVTAMITMASNPLLSQADTRLVHSALKRLDLLVVLELFMTPTAMLADYVFPAAGSLEQAMMQTNAGVANVAYGGPAALSPLYERRADFYFWRDLARRCGQVEHWPWETLEDALDDVLKPTGLSWVEFCETGSYYPERNYQKYLTRGFATPSGKVELRSSFLEGLGYDPLPAYAGQARRSKVHPFTLITGVRRQPYISSQFRQIESLRKMHTHPTAEMEHSTAEKLGLKQGDRIWIETDRGRIQCILTLMEMLPDTVAVEYGWWYPEQNAAEPALGGIWESNANVLTSADIEDCDPVLGQWSYRNLRCNVRKVADDEETELRAATELDRTKIVTLLQDEGMDYVEPVDSYVIAVAGDVVQGCGRVEDHGSYAMLRPLAVAAQFRRRGLGRRLIENIAPDGKPLALVSRQDAEAFYRGLGFSDTGWESVSAEQRTECCACPDRAICIPRPMVREPRTRSGTDHRK